MSWKFIIVLPFLLLNVSFISGNTYYVAKNGSDDNVGSITDPFLSIAVGVSNISSGDTLFIRSGQYYERVSISNINDVSNWTLLSSYQEEEVTINGNEISMEEWGNGLVEVLNCSRVIISGLKVINSNANAIYAYNSNYVVIKNNYTNNSVSSGIGMWFSKNVSVIKNEVVLACNDGGQECISVAGCDTFSIEGNHVHDSGPGSGGGEGIDAKHSANGKVFNNHVHHINRLGIYVDSWDLHTHTIDVYSNTVHDCNVYGIVLAAENGGLLENIKVYNNLVYNNKYYGIAIEANEWGEDNALHPMNNLFITNNTIYNNGTAAGWGIGLTINCPDTTLQSNIYIRNNIISNHKGSQMEVVNAPSNMVITNNLFYGDSDVKGSDFQDGDPLFNDVVNLDFSIPENSIAVDKGIKTDAPLFDFLGNNRPSVSDAEEVDIGAIEYVGETFVKKNSKREVLNRENFVNIKNKMIKFSCTISKKSYSSINVYNTKGVLVLSSGKRLFEVGKNELILNTSQLASGIYLYQISSNVELITGKLTINQ